MYGHIRCIHTVLANPKCTLGGDAGCLYAYFTGGHERSSWYYEVYVSTFCGLFKHLKHVPAHTLLIQYRKEWEQYRRNCGDWVEVNG